MIGNLEALVALAECGTMSKAALRLSITQSAVSKRIASLQARLGKPLVERSGRRVELTPYALHIQQRTRPLLGELREALSEEVADNTGQLSVAIGAAILIAWGAEVLAKVRQENPGIRLRINTYRGPDAIERVRSGEYMVGICLGRSESTPDLEARYVVDETIVIVPNHLRPFDFPASGELQVLTTAPQSETWRFIERQIRRGERQWGVKIHVGKHHGVIPGGNPNGEGRIRPRLGNAGGGAGVWGACRRAGPLSRAGAQHPDQPVRAPLDVGAVAGADISGIAETESAGAELGPDSPPWKKVVARLGVAW